MITANIHQVKTNFSYYLGLVQKGQKVIVAKRNVPIAEIKQLNKSKPKRMLGQSKEKIVVPNEFFEPLPESVIKTFTNPK